MFISAFIAGSFLPFSSEAVMTALIAAGLQPLPLLIYATVGNWAGSMFKKAAVGGNVRVLVQQPTAIARAALLINPAYLTAAIPMATAHPKRTYQEMMDHVPIAKWKAWGFYSTDVSSASKKTSTAL